MADAGAKALHTAARRYCIDRLEATQARWHVHHLALARGGYDRKVLDVARQCYEASAINDFARLMASPGDETDERLLSSSSTTSSAASRTTSARPPTPVPSSFSSASRPGSFGVGATRQSTEARSRRGNQFLVMPSNSSGTGQACGLPGVRRCPHHRAGRQVGPLPLRQVMGPESKRQRVRKRLAQRWQVDPSSPLLVSALGRNPRLPDVLALRQHDFLP